jgi:hypothetical protein
MAVPLIGGQSTLWWNARATKGADDANSELANWVTRVAVARETAQTPNRWRSVIFNRHMTGRPNSPQFSYAMARRPVSQQAWYAQYEFAAPTYNSIAATMDIYINRLFRNHSFLSVAPDRGNFKMSQDAKQLEQWIDGAFDDSGMWKQWSKMGLDSGTCGSGWFKFHENDYSEMQCSLIHRDELLWANPEDDRQEEVIHRVWANRDEVVDRWGTTEARKKAILGAQAYPAFYLGVGLDCSNVIPLLNAYKLPHGPKRKKPGREVLVVGNVTLDDCEYSDDRLPFEGYQFHELNGVDGQGLAEILLTLDDEFNTELAYITENIHRCGFPKWMVEANSGVNPDSLGDISAAVVEYLITKPEMVAPPPNSPQMFQNLDRLLTLIRQRGHISEAAVENTTPVGLKSGTAIDKYQQVEDASFGEMGARLEAFLVRCGYQMIRLGKKLKPAVTLAGNKRQVIDWVDLPMKSGRPKFLKAFPMSRLSQLPAGKQEQLDEMLRTQVITKQMHTRASQVMDLNGMIDLLDAPQDSCDRQLDRIMESGDYEPPAPFLDLVYAVAAVESRYLLEQDNGAPIDRLDLLLQWRAACKEQLADESKPDPTSAPLIEGPTPGAVGIQPPGGPILDAGKGMPVAAPAPLVNPQSAIQ